MRAGYQRFVAESENPSDNSLSFCAVYRPSLTDSKIRANNWNSLHEAYQLVPATVPVRRPWCRYGDELHLEHQLYAKEQGHLKFVTRQHPEGWEIPRLGVQITVSCLDSIDPAEERWQGTVRVRLSVATKETLGIKLEDKDDLLRHWCLGDMDDIGKLSEDDDQFSFLCKAFGFRFVNLVRDESGELTGPRRFAELTIDDGYVQGTWTVKGVFSNPADLSYFPFDTCSWDVIVSIIGASPGVIYDWSTLRNFREFEIMGMHGIARPTDNRWYPYACEQIVVPNSGRGGEHILGCRFYSRRKPEAKLYSFAMPITLSTFLGVISMAQGSGWLRNEMAQTDPIALQGGLFLTIIAIKFSVSDTPKGLGAATLLDKFFMACVCLQVVSMMSLAFMTVQELNFIRAPYIYLSGWLLLHVTIGLDGFFNWYVPTALEGDKIYTKPHQEDEPLDEEYLWPGQQDHIRKAHISFVQKVGGDNKKSTGSASEAVLQDLLVNPSASYTRESTFVEPARVQRFSKTRNIAPYGSTLRSLMSERLEDHT